MSAAQYTSDQLLAVERVMKLKSTDYYTILLVEKSCTSSEIKKAYRKQALIMHPDKNSAPRSDEAFKRVSDAFQVLSDESQRRIFDQTGADPRSRATAGPSGGFPGGGGFNGFGGFNSFGGGPRFARASPADDIFAQFFGGPSMAAGGGGPFQFQFAGGDADDLLSQLFGGVPRTRARRPTAQQQAEQSNRDQTYTQLILIAVILILPTLLSWMFGSSSQSLPSMRFESVRPYTEKHFTPKYNVPFYVNPKDTKDISDAKLRTLGKHAENQFISSTRTMCSHEYLSRQQDMQDALGWFFTDQEVYDSAKEKPMPHCDLLSSLGIQLQY